MSAREYLRGNLGVPNHDPEEERREGRTPYAEWVGSRKRGYLWVGTDNTCFFHMSRANALRLARLILDSADEASNSGGRA